MTKTLVGHYESVNDAQRAVEELEAASFTKDNVSFVGHDGSGRFADKLEGKSTPGSGTANGTVSGLLLGLAALAIPGIGPVVAGGPLALALVGGATGGLIGAFADMGLPETESKHWAERVEKGGFLVIVRTTGDNVTRADEILRGRALEVRVHEESDDREETDNHQFENYGAEGGSSQWGQRVLQVHDDEVVVAERSISRDKGSAQFDIPPAKK